MPIDSIKNSINILAKLKPHISAVHGSLETDISVSGSDTDSDLGTYDSCDYDEHVENICPCVLVHNMVQI